MAGDKRGDVEQLETELREDIEQALQELEPEVGPWTVVWGPVVYQVPGSRLSDNAMVVAQRAGEDGKPPQLVVANSGTNPTSAFGWLIEDSAVTVQVPWRYGNPPAGAKISLGTFTGFSILQHMKPAAGFAGSGLKIRDFLATQTASEVDVTLTGHSLGGALSPTLTLWLSDTRDRWDPSANATLACQPTAGATPGNAAFATYYDNELAGSTNRIFNRIDMVPQAWEKDDLEQVPGLYKPQISPGLLVRLFVELAISISRFGGYTQLVEQTATGFAGQVDTAIIDPKKSKFENFFVQTGFQHVMAYHQFMGVRFPRALEMTLIRCFGVQRSDPIAILRRRLQRARKGTGKG